MIQVTKKPDANTKASETVECGVSLTLISPNATSISVQMRDEPSIVNYLQGRNNARRKIWKKGT